MTLKQSKNPKKTNIPKWLHLLAFVPSIGMLYGFIILALGLRNNDKSQIIWGIVGFLFSPIFWFTFFVVFDGEDLIRHLI